jgi:energy-coupling factor transporter ATP-binding protein EcfA2
MNVGQPKKLTLAFDQNGATTHPMISFPILERLDIHNYGLFPGANASEPGLHVQFQSGLTLVLGANGLGKTTLVTILYRLLTGPYDIPRLSSRSQLGSIDLEPRPLQPAERAVFARRVADGAKNSSARLSFRLGGHLIEIERRLKDLTLTHFSIDGRSRDTNELFSFHTELPKLAGIWSFSDWILLLRYLVFYSEDRQALVWDASAQRQVLRFLFLSAEKAIHWTRNERDILELDSHIRNVNFVVTREVRALSEVQAKLEESSGVRTTLETLEGLQQIDFEQRERLQESVTQADSRRHDARLRMLKAEQERETRYRAAERAKLMAIEARFPGKTDTARYILAQLMTKFDCLVCGQSAPQAAVQLEQRIEDSRCVVCGSELSTLNERVPATTLVDLRVKKGLEELEEFEPELAESRRQFRELDSEYSQISDQLADLNAKVLTRAAEIEILIGRLPPDEIEIHQQRTELGAMRARIEVLRRELEEKRQAFSAFIEEESRVMSGHSAEIQDSFAHYAEGFLLEECSLVWSPRSTAIGQGGAKIAFPNFELDMTGSDFPSPVRRTGPEQVSESQREFIDLSFRMALMQVSSNGTGGSLIIDAPESSLDAVFVIRAANVLTRFAAPSRGNRLVIMSNLIEGELLPTLIRGAAPAGSGVERIVNLFSVAEPTSASRQLSQEYKSILDNLIDAITNSATPKET